MQLDTDITPVSEFRANAAVDEVELLRDVRTAVEQVEAGNGVSNREAKAELRGRFSRA